MSKELIVGDYIFDTLEEANTAKLEKDKIERLNEKLVSAEADIYFKVYNKSIEKNTFKTPVGLDFMRLIKRKIEKLPEYKDKILPIPVSSKGFDNLSKEEKNDSIKKYKEDAAKYSSFFKWSLLINGVLVVIIIALFVISSTSQNPNIINYENALIDKYAAWETELKDKEQDLKERERALEEKEDSFTQNEY